MATHRTDTRSRTLIRNHFCTTYLDAYIHILYSCCDLFTYYDDNAFNRSVSDCLYEVMRSIYAIRLIFNFRLQFNWDHYIYVCVCLCVYMRLRLFIVLMYAMVDYITLHCVDISFKKSLFSNAAAPIDIAASSNDTKKTINFKM